MSSANLSINAHRLELTPAIREYVLKRLDRVLRHTEGATAAIVNLSVEPLKHCADITVRVPGKELFCESVADDLYAAIDALADKADRMVLKHKGKQHDRSHTARRAAV
ncbi:ribosome hibernation-promoting factor, HPF/YfiA family [Oligella urethralis]|uniref:ribosome hibernation-promoting factor, HPF/YfiA family n=1 Tax=Oligella urethralis TaxID=90245 RepID=UPI0027BAF115|nr:ribosome-associated translation inhibitor RaiA [Oligella urethralis]